MSMVYLDPPPTVYSGKHIPRPTDEQNVLSLRYQQALVRAVNAFLHMEVDGGKLLISDNNAKLIIDGSSSSSSATSSDLPWQITLQDTPDGRTVQVGDGVVFSTSAPGFSSTSASQANSSGAATNHTVAAGVAELVWLEVSGTTATVTFGEAAALPADWEKYPAPQAADYGWPGTSGVYPTGYVLLGIVNAISSPTVITQYVFDTPVLFEEPLQRTYFDRNGWVASTVYRRGTILKHSGATYIRGNILNGDDGGTPGASSDWEAI